MKDSKPKNVDRCR